MKTIRFTFILLLIFIFLKTDFRLQQDINCCGDDHDYYSHAETISIDFDLDYSNQLKGYENARYTNNKYIAPIGFIGSGFLAAPFLLLGNVFDYFINLNDDLNFKILFYSFSSIFYLYLTFLYLIKTKNMIFKEFKNIYVLFLLLGSGVTYYAFERYSMTHIYETFTITMISYFVVKISNNFDLNSQKINLTFLAIFLFLSFNVRWVNYFIFIIPLFLPFLLNNQKLNFYKSKFFISVNLIFLSLTLLINQKIYGITTLNPNDVYSKNNLGSSFKIFENFTDTFFSFIKILFSQEFGILYFSPIIFFGLVILSLNLIKDKDLFSLLGLLMFLQVFAIVVIWQSTASAYGFRYLLCLTPISILIFINWFKNSTFLQKDKILFSLIFLSGFSTISTIFFETTFLTQLSLDLEINTFGKELRYTQPEYLKGYILSFFELNSYLKIFVTSYLGLYFFSILFSFISVDTFFDNLSTLGLNLNDEKVYKLLGLYSRIEIEYLIVVFCLVFFLAKKVNDLINSDL